MQAPDLDSTYTALAQAVHAAGGRSELFLAMLSLKLISQSDDAAQMRHCIQSVLNDLQTHEKVAL
jgi:non-ribosomal peptide synthetase component F